MIIENGDGTAVSGVIQEEFAQYNMVRQREREEGERKENN